mmetsp:Transcript_38481/g.84068  ORF Transcript_38481/g.84068 Transcript_38481/m.84068 type:complete len:94 (-) Transcript_38481:86-367(-)
MKRGGTVGKMKRGGTVKLGAAATRASSAPRPDPNDIEAVPGLQAYALDPSAAAPGAGHTSAGYYIARMPALKKSVEGIEAVSLIRHRSDLPRE